MKTRFNLDKWLEDKSLKVVTRDGRKARIVCTDRIGEYPVVALIEMPERKQEHVGVHTEKGEYSKGNRSDCDLFFTDGAELDDFQDAVKKIMYDHCDATPSDIEVIETSEKLMKLAEKVYKK